MESPSGMVISYGVVAFSDCLSWVEACQDIGTFSEKEKYSSKGLEYVVVMTYADLLMEKHPYKQNHCFAFLTDLKNRYRICINGVVSTRPKLN